MRKYGQKPFRIAVIHGGPGVPGEMASVAVELSADTGVLEPLQKAGSIVGQVEELKELLENNGDLPITLIGFSWGAWLSYIFTALNPTLVKKLILISSGPFEEKYVTRIMETRLHRLNKDDKKQALSFLDKLDSPIPDSKIFASFGELMVKADSYDLLPRDNEVLQYQPLIYQSVWNQASKLRNTGELLEMGKRIECSVVAIHGDYDPHPADGVKLPLSLVLKDFRFVLLEKCGHYPWLERRARQRFYDALKSMAK